ncbi:hypothetical protein DPX16_23861 [Anabarilius grahami]|uniref:Uncharacterized protein n=1 Tax=Anabarilius grahami TaxID=495550 RepID=A0A3N0YJ56_ANAGA|nr:hypothetical protein DPX16_23861 [Anabarilius grahami]
MDLHTMAILQAYQVDVLKEMDEGDGLTPEEVKELRRATDLALRATKHTSGLFGEAVNMVVDKFWTAKSQLAALRQFMPKRVRDSSILSSSLPKERSLHRKDSANRRSDRVHPPLSMVWGPCGRPLPRQQPHRRLELKRHVWFSPGAGRPHIGHTCCGPSRSASGRRALSFAVVHATLQGPVRHSITSMSSTLRHTASLFTFLSRMEYRLGY